MLQERTTTRPGAVALTVALAGMTLVGTVAGAQEGWWTARHGDPGRTGVAVGQGDLTRPAPAWQVSIGQEVPGARVLVEDVTGDGALEYLTLVDGAVVARDRNDALLWDTPPLGVSAFARALDFDGDGVREVLLTGALVVVLDGQTGQAKFHLTPDDPATLSFRAGVAVPVNIDDDPESELLFASADKIVSLYDFSQGYSAPPLWTNTDAALPGTVLRPVVGDFDGDGQAREIAVVNQSNCQVVFISMDTGATLRVTGALTQGLFCYGLYQAANLDDDAQDELLFTGAVGGSQGSIGITVYDYVADGVQWQHEYARNNAAKTTLSPSGAVVDLDNDGALEVVTAVFGNDVELAGDDGVSLPDGWGVVVYDAATGATLGALPDRLVAGLADVDHDGVQDLVTRSTTPGTLAPPAVGTLEVWGLDGERAPELRYALEGAAPVLRQMNVNATVSSRDYNQLLALFDTDSDGDASLLVARGGDEQPTVVQALEFGDGDTITPLVQVELEGGVGVTLIQSGEGLFEDGGHAVLRSTLGRFRVYNGELTAQQALVLSGHTSEVLAARLVAGDALQLIYREATGALVALDPTGAGPLQAPTRLWSRDNGGGEYIAFDSDGDGLAEVALASTDDDGVQYIELLGSNGQPLWRQPIADARQAAISLVHGQFGGAGGADGPLDLAALVRTNANAFLTMTWDGADGSVLSTHQAVGAQVGSFPNRELLARGDIDGDGFDDLVLTHYTTFERLSGADLTRDGDAVRLPAGTSRPSNSSMLNNEGGQSLFMKAFYGSLLVMDLGAGTTTWQETLPLSQTNYVSNYAGQADANGDGRLDVAVPGQLGDLAVYDGANGSLLYRRCLSGGQSMPLPEAANPETCRPFAPISSVATGDVDGDGELEFVVGDSEGFLYALNVADGSPSWVMDLQSRARFPALADVDGDGQLEIILTTTRSELVAIDQAEITATTEVREVAFDGDQVVDPDVDLDRQTRLDAVGAAWEPVARADRYLVSLLTSNNTVVVEPQAITEVSHVFTGLRLIPGTTYVVSVAAVSDSLGAAPATLSDGLLAVGAAPRVLNLQAAPNPATLGVDTGVTITGRASADGVTRLSTVTVRVLGADDAVFFEQTLTPGVTNLNLNATWDMADAQDQPAPAGAYTVEVSATDEIGASVVARAGLTLREPGDPLITDFIADPTSFNPAADQRTALSATVRADQAASLDEVALEIRDGDDALVFEERFAPGTVSFALRTTWDGRDLEDALVAPGDYTATLTATDNLGNDTSASLSLSIAEPGDPVIADFVATPDSFDPASGQTTELTATITATGPIERVDLTIVGLDNQPIVEARFTPDTDAFSLRTTWDGRFDGAVVAPGEYTALLRAQDVFGHSVEATTTVTVTPPGATQIANFVADPDTFDAGLGQETLLSATVRAGNQGDLSEVVLEIRGDDEALVFEERFTPGTASFALRAIWDGRDPGGALVAPGDYGATLTATNSFGSVATASLILTVLVTEEPGEDTGTPDQDDEPDAGDEPDADDTPDAGDMPDAELPEVPDQKPDNCTCATPGAPAPALPGGWALLALLGAAVLIRRRRR